MIKYWSCYPHESGLVSGETAYTITLTVDNVSSSKTFSADFVNETYSGWDYLVAGLEQEVRSEEIREWLRS